LEVLDGWNGWRSLAEANWIMQMKDSSDQIRQRNAREVKPTLSKEILR